MATRITIGQRKSVIRAPADSGHFVANLHHRGPDVIEELNLGNGLQTANRQSERAADDGSLGNGGVEAPRASEGRL